MVTIAIDCALLKLFVKLFVNVRPCSCDYNGTGLEFNNSCQNIAPTNSHPLPKSLAVLRGYEPKYQCTLAPRLQSSQGWERPALTS